MNFPTNCHVWSAFLPAAGVALAAWWAFGAAAGCASAADATVAPARPETMWVYIGGAGPKGGAIYRCRLKLATGELTKPEIAADVTNPSFLAYSPCGKYLYAVLETGNFQGAKAGGMAAFAIDSASGALKLLNEQSTGGPGPCFVGLDAQGRCAMAANYGGGSVCAFPVGADGRLGERSAFIQHDGKGPSARRQGEPHAHAIGMDPSGRFALAVDLGCDKVFIYRFDAAKATLTPHDPAFMDTKPGAGPRHLAFHPNGKWAYVINELDNTVIACTWDAEKGVLSPMQTISALPDDFKGKSSCAEILVDPSGRFVYGSNRGHDSIVLYAVDPATGKLTAKSWQSTQGKQPRHFSLDPTGRWMLAANQKTGNVVVFAVDAATGALKPTGQSVAAPNATFVQALAAPEANSK